MWDKRVFRGSPMAPVVTLKTKEAPISNAPIRARPKQEEEVQSNNRRANIEIFTDELVETLTDKPPHYEYGQQTEAEPTKKVQRHRMPVKKGQDIETQIWDNELFNFDYEVEPLLNALCGRTLEISRLEVLQEEELRVMADRRNQLHKLDQEEIVKIKKMYEDEEALENQNQEILKAFRREKEARCKTHQRVFGRVLAKEYLLGIKEKVLDEVNAQGYFRPYLESALLTELLPIYHSKIAKISESHAAEHEVAVELLAEAKKILLSEHALAKENERKRKDGILKKREELKKEKECRKIMAEEEKEMKIFLAEEKEKKAKLEAERLKEEENKAVEEGGKEENP